MSRRRSPRDKTNGTLPDKSAGYTNPNNTVESIGQACPDPVTAVYNDLRALGVYVRPRDLRRLYAYFMENAQTDWDFGGYVLTYLTRRGEISRSVPADPVGERVASRLAGAA